MSDKSLNILLVDDDDAHCKLLTRSLKSHGFRGAVERVVDGAEALEYLRAAAASEARQSPDLILLDLKLPRMSGIELLQIIKADPELRLIPVVILTTSSALQDRAAAYDSYANSYLTKNSDYEQFSEMIRDLDVYWTQWNQPAREPAAGRFSSSAQ